MLGKKTFKPKIFYNISLDKMVSKDDYYRRLDKVLNLSFVYKECKDLYGKTGNPSIDPVVFFKIIIAGYLENIIYDRHLARRIKDSLSIRLFLGYDIDEDTPCHSTISRTRAKIPFEVFKKVFSYMLFACIDSNLVDGSHLAVDSALSKANASLDSLERKNPQYSIDEYSEQTRKMNISDKKPTTKRTNSTHRSTTDPDSRIATKPGKPVDLYFKENISVDPKRGVIVHPELTHADINDSRTIYPIVESSKKVLLDKGLNLLSISADKGYCIGKCLKELEKLDIEAYIPLIARTINTNVLTIDQFIYDKDNDCFTCPKGKALYYKSNNGRSKRYRASYRDCKQCSLKQSCCPKNNGRGRLLFIPIYKEQYDKLEQRLKTPMARKAAKLRLVVERAFGELLHQLGTRKLNTIGIANAKKKFIMAAFTYNLKKYLKYGYKYISTQEKTKKSNFLAQYLIITVKFALQIKIIIENMLVKGIVSNNYILQNRTCNLHFCL